MIAGIKHDRALAASGDELGTGERSEIVTGLIGGAEGGDGFPRGEIEADDAMARGV